MTTLFLDTSFSRFDISVNPVQLLTLCFFSLLHEGAVKFKTTFSSIRALSSVQILFHNFLARGLQHLTSIVKVSTMPCFVLANLATVARGSRVPKCQAWTAIPLTLWDISERQGRCYSEVVVFHFHGSNRTGFVETKCRFNFPTSRRTSSSLLGGLHF